jgi:hypothetical protein
LKAQLSRQFSELDTLYHEEPTAATMLQLKTLGAMKTSGCNERPLAAMKDLWPLWLQCKTSGWNERPLAGLDLPHDRPEFVVLFNERVE